MVVINSGYSTDSMRVHSNIGFYFWAKSSPKLYYQTRIFLSSKKYKMEGKRGNMLRDIVVTVKTRFVMGPCLKWAESMKES